MMVRPLYTLPGCKYLRPRTWEVRQWGGTTGGLVQPYFQGAHAACRNPGKTECSADYGDNLRPRFFSANTTSPLNSQLADSTTTCDDVEGIAVPENVESNALTDFVNEACNLTSVRGTSFVDPTGGYVDGFAMDIKSYLGRPNIWTTGPFTQTPRTDSKQWD
jgi:hypothetical protein